MARLQCLCLSDRHSRSFKTSSEDDSYDSGLSVREEIRFRVSQLDEERRKTNMRVVKLRQKIESRRVGVNNIIASLGLVLNQRNAPPPSLAQLRNAIQSLEQRKKSCERELEECLRSDAYCIGRELEADVIDGHCEYTRLKKRLEDVSQYEEVIRRDIDEARRRLKGIERDRQEIEEMRQSIEVMQKELAGYDTKAELADDEGEEAITSDIGRLDETLSAERMSASTAMDSVRESTELLSKVAREAEERIRAAMKRHAEKENGA